MKKTIPIVIGTYYNAYSVIRGFGEKGIKSILVTCGERCFVQKSKYIETIWITRNVNESESGFIEDLIKYGKEISPNKGMFFPTHDEQLLAISKFKAILEPYFEIPFSDYSILKEIMDKDSFSETCKRLGIPTIRDYKIRNYDEAKTALEEFGVPILVKVNQWDIRIIKGFGSKIAVFEDPDKYLSAISHFFDAVPDGELLVQEYISDSERLMPNVNSFTDREGNMQCVFVSEKLRQYPPQRGTSTATYSMNPEDPQYSDIIEYSRKICKHFRFYGLFGIEYKFDPKDGLYKIIEMNCRSEFPNYLQTLVGQNMAYEIYNYHLGEKVTIPFYPLVKSASCYVPVLDKFYVTKSNKYNYPKFTMTRGEWRKSIIKPSTMYGLTVRDYRSFVSAQMEALKKTMVILFRAKFLIPENISTKEFVMRKLPILGSDRFRNNR